MDVALQAYLEIALLTPKKGHQKATNAAAQVMVSVVEGQQWNAPTPMTMVAADALGKSAA